MDKLNFTKSFIIAFIIFMLSNINLPSANAQTINPVKARKLFIEHFMKYILWPKADYQKDFIISVYKDDKIYKELKSTLEERNFRGRTIFVKKTTNPEDLKGSAMIYLPSLKEEEAETIVTSLGSTNALLITNIYNEGKKGSAINFIEKNGRLSFELDLAITQKSGYKVFSQLKQLATLI